MANLQIDVLCKGLPLDKQKEYYELDEAITVLYINEYIPRSVMTSCRDKLVKNIKKEVTND